MTSMVYIQDDHIHNQSGIDCYVDRHTSYVSHHQEVQSQFALDSLLYRPYKSLYNIYLYYNGGFLHRTITDCRCVRIPRT
jgi:hypothetical protein